MLNRPPTTQTRTIPPRYGTSLRDLRRDDEDPRADHRADDARHSAAAGPSTRGSSSVARLRLARSSLGPAPAGPIGPGLGRPRPAWPAPGLARRLRGGFGSSAASVATAFRAADAASSRATRAATWAASSVGVVVEDRLADARQRPGGVAGRQAGGVDRVLEPGAAGEAVGEQERPLDPRQRVVDLGQLLRARRRRVAASVGGRAVERRRPAAWKSLHGLDQPRQARRTRSAACAARIDGAGPSARPSAAGRRRARGAPRRRG